MKIISVDINSRNGTTILVFDVHSYGRVERRFQARPRPKNRKETGRSMRLLDSYIAKPSSEKLAKLLETLPKGLQSFSERTQLLRKRKDQKRTMLGEEEEQRDMGEKNRGSALEAHPREA